MPSHWYTEWPSWCSSCSLHRPLGNSNIFFLILQFQLCNAKFLFSEVFWWILNAALCNIDSEKLRWVDRVIFTHLLLTLFNSDYILFSEAATVLENPFTAQNIDEVTIYVVARQDEDFLSISITKDDQASATRPQVRSAGGTYHEVHPSISELHLSHFSAFVFDSHVMDSSHPGTWYQSWLYVCWCRPSRPST